MLILKETSRNPKDFFIDMCVHTYEKVVTILGENQQF